MKLSDIMNVRNVLSKWLSPAALALDRARRFGGKESASWQSITTLGIGQAIWRARDYQGFAREGYQRNADVYTCIRLIKDAAKGIPLKVFERGPSGGRPKEITTGPLYDMLHRPNPRQSQSSFVESVFGYWLCSGNSYVERVGPGPGAPPVELYALRPDRMEIIKGDNQHPIRGYRYKAGLVPVTWEPDLYRGGEPVHQILHMKFFNPIDDWYGLCYSEDTEIMTRDRGWVLLRDLTSSDLVATRNTSTRQFEWQTPVSYISRPYEGEMYHFTSRTVDLMVTPEHRMLVWSMGGGRRGRERILPAKELATRTLSRRHHKVPLTSEWTGVEVPIQEFPCVRDNGDWTFRVSGDDYCALLGAYLAEGNIRSRGGIEINQQKGSRGFELFRALIQRINNGRDGYNGKAFIISRQSMTEHFKQFGHSHEKYVPAVIRNATVPQLRIFLDYYLAGDGNYEKSTGKGQRGKHPKLREAATTTSRMLADHLVEIAQKLGHSASVKERPARFQTVIGQRCWCRTSYRIRFRYSPYAAASHCARVGYSGKIYCVAVPNGIVYVRRNGLPAWCGNSPVEPAARAIDQANSAQEWNVALMQNQGRPGLVVTGDMTLEQMDRLESTINVKFTGPENAGRSLIMGGQNLKVDKLSLTPHDIDWAAGQEHAALKIYSCFGVPPEMAGDSSRRTYANYSEARRAFYQETVLPMLDLFTCELTCWIAPFFSDQVRIGYDHNDIEAIQEEHNVVWQRAIQGWDSGLLRMNEARELIGKDAVEGGEVYKQGGQFVESRGGILQPIEQPLQPQDQGAGVAGGASGVPATAPGNGLPGLASARDWPPDGKYYNNLADLLKATSDSLAKARV